MSADTVGGVWTFALDLARELTAAGHDVVLATMGGGLEEGRRIQALEIVAELHESEFRLEWMTSPWADVDRAGDWLLGLEARIRPDIVHLNGYAHGGMPWAAPCMVAGHSCVVSWWWSVHGEEPPARYDEYRQRVTEGLQAANMVVAPSRFMLEALLRHYGPLPHRRVIHNGRTAKRFTPLRKWPFIASVGRLWDPAKNIAGLAAVAKDLSWPVYVAGDTIHPDTHGTQINGLGDVHPLGNLSEDRVAEFLGRASIYVHPARYEPFGLSVLEAALAGCALVLHRLPSLEELWHDAAVFVEPDDTEATRREINRLIEHPAALDDWGRRARQRAGGLTSLAMAEAYITAYDELTRSAPRQLASS